MTGANPPFAAGELLRLCREEAPKIVKGGEKGNDKGTAWVRVWVGAGDGGFGLRCVPTLTRLEFSEGLLLELGTQRTDSGHPAGHLILMGWITEAVKKTERAWVVALNTLLHQQPPKPMTAEEAWFARDLDVWEGVSERDFKEQWLASRPERLDEDGQLEADRTADRARSEASRAELTWDPAQIRKSEVGERVSEEVHRMLEHNARETERIVAAGGQEFTASDEQKLVMVTVGGDELFSKLWLHEDVLRRYGSELQKLIVKLNAEAKAGMRRLLTPSLYGQDG